MLSCGVIVGGKVMLDVVIVSVVAVAGLMAGIVVVLAVMGCLFSLRFFPLSLLLPLRLQSFLILQYFDLCFQSFPIFVLFADQGSIVRNLLWLKILGITHVPYLFRKWHVDFFLEAVLALNVLYFTECVVIIFEGVVRLFFVYF